ncbi:alpha/beta hydrolase [Burkholderia sp. Bp9142]|uniref:alpha/beta hydrolase n=1 Tax=Burkholderia sp. Bp9142 TaxID=2184573 RepID=UPI0016233562|nr:alpha/beta fold hydrolase [Burkholderia sp. Bp9142]
MRAILMPSPNAINAHLRTGTTSSLPVIVATDHRIASGALGVQLHVRNKRLATLHKPHPDKVVVFVHGATFPGSMAFDHPMFGGGSWLDYLALHGFDTYLFDVRGYGRSSRPAASTFPVPRNPPYARTPEAGDDLSAVVEFVRARTSGARVNLIGWSWGTALGGGFTAARNEAVRHLVLVAPLWIIRNSPGIALSRWMMSMLPPPLPNNADFLGDFRAISKKEARQRWVRGLDETTAEQLIPQAEFDTWWQALFEIQGRTGDSAQTVQAPNGVMADLIDHWATSRATYEPEHIRVPTQLLLGEWDIDTPAYMAQELFSRLKHAPYKRLEILARGTHSMALELNRFDLFDRCREFLETRFV